MPTTVATWNVNSVKARLPHLLEWLATAAPEVVLLQETKCVNEEFPRLELESQGWHLALRGQKTYNGVAILSRHKIVEEIASLDLLAGSVLDYVENLAGSMFVMTNPNATATCGCGTSFAA